MDKKTDLGELHDALARDLLRLIKEGSATPADKRVALDLLKHNGVDGGDRDRPDNPIRPLTDTMPFPTLEDTIPPRI